MRKIKTLTEGGRCQFKGCRRVAKELVYNRRERVVQVLCLKHSNSVIDDEGPVEYARCCPNCYCMIPVE